SKAETLWSNSNMDEKSRSARIEFVVGSVVGAGVGVGVGVDRYGRGIDGGTVVAFEITITYRVRRGGV
ncbi:hypothetical protein Tco_0063698, partial [Tanacetum coccineum]